MYERTMKDLQESFAGESMANKKYLAFAEQADGLVALKGKDADWYLCPICGFVHEGWAPDIRPICKAERSVFVKNPAC